MDFSHGASLGHFEVCLALGRENEQCWPRFGKDGTREILEELMRLDPRGGHYTQKVMSSALKLALEGSNVWDLFSLTCLEDGMSKIQEGLDLVAYKLRVCCAHVRNRFDATAVTQDGTLVIIFCLRRSLGPEGGRPGETWFLRTYVFFQVRSRLGPKDRRRHRYKHEASDF